MWSNRSVYLKAINCRKLVKQCSDHTGLLVFSISPKRVTYQNIRLRHSVAKIGPAVDAGYCYKLYISRTVVPAPGSASGQRLRNNYILPVTLVSVYPVTSLLISADMYGLQTASTLHPSSSYSCLRCWYTLIASSFCTVPSRSSLRFLRWIWQPRFTLWRSTSSVSF